MIYQNNKLFMAIHCFSFKKKHISIITFILTSMEFSHLIGQLYFRNCAKYFCHCALSVNKDASMRFLDNVKNTQRRHSNLGLEILDFMKIFCVMALSHCNVLANVCRAYYKMIKNVDERWSTLKYFSP